MLVSKKEWENTDPKVLRAYNNRGESCKLLFGGQNFGVHRDNLADSRGEAAKNREGVYKAIFGADFVPSRV